MKRQSLKVLLLTGCLLPVALAAQAQFNYVTNNGAITITGYSGSNSVVAIPNTINGFPVTSIGTNAFAGNYLAGFTIGTNVTSIGSDAFYDCTNLLTVIIPGGVTNIGDAAFFACLSLTNIILTNSLPNIGNEVFFGCGSLVSVTIPNSVGSIGDSAFQASGLASVTFGTNLTTIGDFAFSTCANLTNITIPNSVTSIGDYAFISCSSLTGATLGSRVAYIGSSAFAGCALNGLTLPTSLTSLGDYAFGGCGFTNVIIPGGVTDIGVAPFEGGGLMAINVATNNPAYISVAGVLFNQGQTTLLEYPGGNSATFYTIPGSVTNIAEDAFADCTNLTGVLIPGSVLNIGEGAFAGCSELANVTIPGSVTTIGYTAFDECTNLAEAYFEGNAPAIEAPLGRIPFVFDGDNSAALYFIPGTTGWSSAFGGLPTEPAFNYTTNNGAITITGASGGFSGALVLPSVISDLPVTVLAGGAFQNNNGLTSITIPESITNIGSFAFVGCSSLTSISVASDNPAYSSAAGVLFNNNQTILVQFPIGNGAVSYTIPSGVTNIGLFAFYNSGLASITFPNSVTSLGIEAFSNCTNLTSLVIPTNVTGLGDSVFEDCYSLTNVTFPNSLLNIGQDAFSVCFNLISLTIPDSVTNISPNAFQECTRLENVTIGSGVTSIGELAFYDCGSLNNVAFGNNITNIGDLAFEGCNLTSVALPDSLTTVGSSAFANSGLTNVMVGKGLMSIGDSAFADCYGLTSLEFQGNAPNTFTDAFFGENPSVFYLPGTSGWSTNLAGLGITPAFIYSTNHSTLTITAGTADFVGPLTIPSEIFGLPVVSLGDYAFAGCSLLSSVAIPDSVTSIGTAPFLFCSSLTQIRVDTNNSAYGSVGGSLFNKAGTALLQYPVGNSQMSYTVPGGVASIGDYAFGGAALASVMFASSVATIGDFAFADCIGLTNVVFGSGLVNLGDFAFEGCASLSIATIPSSVSSIGVAPFLYCANLGAINVAANNPMYLSVEGILFNHSQTTLIEYPEGKAETSYTLPSSVNNLGDYAFASTVKLTSLFFQTNAPNADLTVFTNDVATVFYVPETGGWGTNFDGLPTELWTLQITSQPLSQSVFPGTNASFSISATGPPVPVAYAWFFDGIALEGATNVSLTISNAQPVNDGYYQAVVTNAFGAITSSIATLTVTDQFVLPGIQFQIAGPTNIVSLQGFVEGATAATTYSWSKLSGLQQVIFANSAFPTNASSTLSSGLDQVTFTDPSSSLSSLIFGFAGTYELVLTATIGTNASAIQATITAGVDPNGQFQNVSNFVNGPLLTNGNVFLSFPNFTNNSTDATNYYAAVDPTSSKTTLTAWKIANGIPTNEIPPTTTNFMNGVVAATYFNCLDLGFGRRMIMSNHGSNWAFAVSNFHTVADAVAGSNKIATVTMDYSAVSNGGQRFTKFYVYNSNDLRVTNADLDGGGVKFIPGLCEACHGGVGGPVMAGASGNVHAHFLAFDVHALDYSSASNLTQAAQESALKLLNQGVLAVEQDIAREDPTYFSPAITNLIEGWYGPGLTNSVQNTSFIPDAWQDQASANLNVLSLAGQAYLYKNVVAPSCRSCHETRSLSQNMDFRSFTNFNLYASGGVNSSISQYVFGGNALAYYPVQMTNNLTATTTMPQARRTFQRFWNSLTPRPEAEILAVYLQGGLSFEVFPPSAPSLTGVEQAGNNLVLEFPAFGGSYTLQSAPDLTHPAWLPLPGTISGNPRAQSIIQVVEPIAPGQPKNFYRVVAQP